MNRTQLFGFTFFICWGLSAIILYPIIFELFEFIIENLVEFWNAIMSLDLINSIRYGINFMIGAIIWIPYYMAGLSSILLMFESE